MARRKRPFTIKSVDDESREAVVKTLETALETAREIPNIRSAVIVLNTTNQAHVTTINVANKFELMGCLFAGILHEWGQ